MILNERDARHEHILQVARQMMTAARTAPKGKGIDIIEVALITDEEIKQLSDTMVAMVEEHGMKFFLRDADNILNAECVILIGTREQAQGLNCGHCGFTTCAGRTEGVPCAINSIDVGIAIGSQITCSRRSGTDAVSVESFRQMIDVYFYSHFKQYSFCSQYLHPSVNYILIQFEIRNTEP